METGSGIRDPDSGIRDPKIRGAVPALSLGITKTYANIKRITVDAYAPAGADYTLFMGRATFDQAVHIGVPRVQGPAPAAVPVVARVTIGRPSFAPVSFTPPPSG